jgi:hypothetical protein
MLLCSKGCQKELEEEQKLERVSKYSRSLLAESVEVNVVLGGPKRKAAGYMFLRGQASLKVLDARCQVVSLGFPEIFSSSRFLWGLVEVRCIGPCR